MKTQKNALLLILLLLCLNESAFAQPGLTLDLGGGITQRQKEAYVNKATTYGGRLYVPITRKGWDGSIKGGFTVGVVASYHIVDPQIITGDEAPKGLNVGGTGVTSSVFRGPCPYKPGFKNGLGLQGNLHAGGLVLSPFVLVGQDQQGANGAEVIQEVTFNGKTTRYVLSSAMRPDTKVLAFTPGVRVGYKFSRFLGIWASGQYTTGGDMTTTNTQFVPNGSPDQNGNYTVMQLEQGQVRPNEATITPYKNVGFSGGLSFSFGGGRPRPRFGVMVTLTPECCTALTGVAPPRSYNTGEVKYKMVGTVRPGVLVKVISAGVTTYEPFRPGFYLGCYPVPVTFELVNAGDNMPLEEGGAINGVAKFVYSSKACSITDKPADVVLDDVVPVSPRSWSGTLEEIFEMPAGFFVVRKGGLDNFVKSVNAAGKGKATVENLSGKKYLKVVSGAAQAQLIEMYPIDESGPMGIIVHGGGHGSASCLNGGCKSCGIPVGGSIADCACLNPIITTDHALQDCRAGIARPLSDLIATPNLSDLTILANADGSLSAGSIKNINDLVIAQMPDAQVKGSKIVTEKKQSYLLVPVVRGKESFTLVSQVTGTGGRRTVSGINGGIWSVMMYCEGGTCSGRSCFSVEPALTSGVISCPCGPHSTNPCKPTFGKMVGWQTE